MRRAWRVDSRRGFTMVEVLVALAVLVIGMVGLLVLATSLLRASGVIGELDCGAALARNKLEELAVEGIYEEGEDEGDFEEQGYPAYQWNVETTSVEDVAGLYEVKVSVQKQDSRRVWRLVTLAREAY